ncbi:MAG: alpha/beta hydrolase [Anaerolineae bacterium]
MTQQQFKPVHFESKDGLLITADLYPTPPSSPNKGLILLCHRSHFHRGEYRETAPKLVELGFICLAIDQRSGMNSKHIKNETSSLAKEKKLPTGYLDARQDIEAAVDYAFELNQQRPIILFGSSYSAALSLLIGTDSEKVKAIITFSPGEHLKKTDVAGSIKSLSKPVFATGPQKESDEIEAVMSQVASEHVTLFKPSPAVDGFHGSKTLWESVKGYEEYWNALNNFLNKAA